MHMEWETRSEMAKIYFYHGNKQSAILVIVMTTSTWH